ncbi:MAG: hypothetical protein IT206_06900 [Fimbriimonadaceae bacterium]|nr:hypothetical protein [Fimbriimonadaceae bacterium]
MTGSWICEIHGGLFEEIWSPPAGGVMVGHGRLVVEGQARFMEFLSIEQNGDAVTMYIALGALSKGEKSPVAFRLVHVDAASVTFEREGADFPTRIEYKSIPDGLPCRLSGPSHREELYAFRTNDPQNRGSFGDSKD